MENYKITSLSSVFVVAMLLVVLLFNSLSAEGQRLQANDRQLFRALPSSLPLPSEPQRYHITTDYFNRTFFGVFVDKIRVSGDFTTNLPGNTEKWNNVRVAKSRELKGEYTSGEPQPYMENFTYQPSEKILKPDFFRDFPMDAVQVRNLVWDMAGIEGFAWGHLDSLRLNKTYEAKNMNGAVNLAGLGSFKNSNIQLTWKGISLINNQLCGLIDFRAMDNPLEVNMKMAGKDFSLKGVSHYWGTVYISLMEKSLAYAELLESVTMEMKWSDQPAAQYVYSTRFMTVEKIE